MLLTPFISKLLPCSFMLLALSSRRPLQPFHVTHLQYLIPAVLPPFSLAVRAQMGPLQRSIRSATFWSATRIPATQHGPAAERLPEPPAPSEAAGSHGHMQNHIFRWPPRNTSRTALVHQTEELGALGSFLVCPTQAIRHEPLLTLHSILCHNEVPPFFPAPHRPAWESSHCFPPQEDI